MFPKSFNSYPLSLSLPLVICWIKGRSGKRGCDHRTTGRVQIELGAARSLTKFPLNYSQNFPIGEEEEEEEARPFCYVCAIGV